MLYKKLFFIFFAFNYQIIEPKVSFIKKAKNFFSNPENKKMILNVATGAICATVVSFIVSYRHEIVQLLWRNGNYYVDPFINPIFIGDYACQGLEKKYKNISIKQIRVSQQSGAQCGLCAFVSATSWIEGSNKNYVTLMQDNKRFGEVVHEYLNQHDTIKQLKGQWIGDSELVELYTQLKEKNKIADQRIGNNLIVIAADKADLSNVLRPQYLYQEIQDKFTGKQKSEAPLYCSIVVGAMQRNLALEEKREEQFSSSKDCNFEMPFGHWYAINIAVNSGSLEIVVTDSLNIDRTHDKAVQMVIDNLMT